MLLEPRGAGCCWLEKTRTTQRATKQRSLPCTRPSRASASLGSNLDKREGSRNAARASRTIDRSQLRFVRVSRSVARLAVRRAAHPRGAVGGARWIAPERIALRTHAGRRATRAAEPGASWGVSLLSLGPRAGLLDGLLSNSRFVRSSARRDAARPPRHHRVRSGRARVLHRDEPPARGRVAQRALLRKRGQLRALSRVRSRKRFGRRGLSPPLSP